MERSKEKGGERQIESIREGIEQGKVPEEWELNPDIQEGSVQGEVKGGRETNEFIKDDNQRKDYKWRAISSDFYFLAEGELQVKG